MVKTKESDFIEIDYIGKIKDTDNVFDLTSESESIKLKIHNPSAKYGSRIICLGQRQILAHLDKELINRETGETYKIEVTPEQGFGKKDISKIKTINSSILKKQNINPFPGLQINASGLFGTVRSVSGGRTIIDFNHPLAGKSLVYQITIHRVVNDVKEKLSSFIDSLLNLSPNTYELKLENNKLELKTNIKLNPQVKTEFISRVKKVLNLDLVFN